ncbi:MAG: signal transduction histidine kinase [Patescibacteria group bacterium]
MKNHLFLLLFLLLSLSAFSQEHAITVQHLTIEDGLSNRFVNSVFQDSKGFIWIATNNGVNRWDGNDMKVFAEYSSVHKVMEDERGRIWFQFAVDNSTFLEKANKFAIHHSSIGTDSLLADEWSVFANLHGTMILRSLKDTMLYSYTDQLNPLPEVSALFKNNNSRSFTPVSKDRFWKIANQRICLLDLKGTIHEVDSISKPYIYLKTGVMEEDTLNYSVISYFEKEETQMISYQHYRKKPGQAPEHSATFSPQTVSEKNLTHQRPPFKKELKTGIIWERKINHLEARDKKGKLVFDFYDYFGRRLTCPDVLFDRQDNAWICTNNGIYRVSISTSLFDSYLKDGTPSNYSTRGILSLKDSLLILSYRGSNMVSIADGGINPLGDTPLGIGFGVGIYVDKKGILYWGEGRYNAINRYDLRNRKLELFKGPPKVNNTCYLPYRDQSSNTLWASGTLCLSILDEEKKELKPFLFDADIQPLNVRHFFEDESGLWMIARNGLFLIDPVAKKILTHYSAENGKLPFNQFNYIHKDKDGSFWLATQGFGLLHWDPLDGSYESYAREEGFISPIIYTIYEDQNDRLWLPTEYGLALFNKKSKTMQVFLEQDGLSHNEFNGFSHHRGNDGRLYFGGLNGVIAFHPDSIFIQNTNINEPLRITAMELLDNTKGGQYIDVAEKTIAKNQLVLTPQNNSFTIRFSFLDYNSQPNIDYAYKLKGLDKEWSYQKSNNIRFTGLPYGNYELLIKAKGNRGFWSSQQVRLPINVIKPYYLRWYFILLCITGLGLLAYSYLRYRTHRLKLDARNLERLVALRTQTIEQQKSDLEQLTQTKDRLYAIIAHDLRDPVESFKGIAGKINFLLKKKDMNHVLKLSAFVESSAEELSKLLENLLQWARHQQKELPFQPEHHNVENLIKEVFGSLQIVATTKSIKLSYDGTPGLDVYGDYNMLTTIFRNLIDNALKFSHPKSSIKVAASIEHNKTMILFQDFGTGMTREQKDMLFHIKKGNTMEGTRGERGTGLGMPLCKELLKTHGAKVRVQSAVEEGTKVWLYFSGGAIS